MQLCHGSEHFLQRVERAAIHFIPQSGQITFSAPYFTAMHSRHPGQMGGDRKLLTASAIFIPQAPSF
jgi:hypothetical protein